MGIIAICGVGYVILSKNKGDNLDTMNNSTKFTSESITSEVKSKKAILVDVRTEQEYAAEHAVGAVNAPLSSIQLKVFPQVDESDVIYVYCHSGARAAVAKVLLNKAGFINVISIKSLDAWVKMGGKTE